MNKIISDTCNENDICMYNYNVNTCEIMLSCIIYTEGQ